MMKDSKPATPARAVSRRGFLGAGAAAGASVAASIAASPATAAAGDKAIVWDREVDIVVIGALLALGIGRWKESGNRRISNVFTHHKLTKIVDELREDISLAFK